MKIYDSGRYTTSNGESARDKIYEDWQEPPDLSEYVGLPHKETIDKKRIIERRIRELKSNIKLGRMLLYKWPDRHIERDKNTRKKIKQWISQIRKLQHEI